MRKAIVIIFLLPLFATAQIIYPNGRTNDDSTTFTLSSEDSLVHYLSGSGWGATEISIDTASDTSSIRLWQIGNTLKPVFSNDTLPVRGIMTDTLNPYPPDANNFFILKMDGAVVSNFIVDFWHRYETDSLHAGGIVEFSTDTGVTWMNIANCGDVLTQNFYLATDTIASGDAAFTGTSIGEQLSRFQFINCWGFKTTVTTCIMQDEIDEYNTIYFRFRFVSDSTIDSLSGWIIDSIRIENPGCVPGYVAEVNQQNEVSLSPNPATTSIIITAQSPINQITITNILGQTMYSNQYSSPQVQIDVSSLPSPPASIS